MEEEDNEETQAFIKSLPYEIPTHENWNNLAQFYHPLMAGSIDGTDLMPHDKAVTRAMRSTYRPNKKVVGDPKKTLMIRNLARHTKEDTVSRVFSRYGDLEKCRLVRDVISGISRGYAFVEYKHERDARQAFRESKMLTIDDCTVVIDFECERTLPGWVPRRFGGGFGGKKESGQLRFGGSERPFRRPIPINSNPLGSKNIRKLNNNGKRDFRMMDDRVKQSNNTNKSDYERNKKYQKRHLR